MDLMTSLLMRHRCSLSRLLGVRFRASWSTALKRALFFPYGIWICIASVNWYNGHWGAGSVTRGFSVFGFLFPRLYFIRFH
jgi:hypothetical protein